MPDVKPQSKTYTLVRFADYPFKKGKEYFLKVSAVTNEEMPFLPIGHEVAWTQIALENPAGKEEAAILEVALFLEDTLGLVLSDEEISEKNLGTNEATERFICEKLDLGEACAGSAEQST